MNNQEYTSQLYRAIANKMVADGFVNGAAMQRLKLATTKARDWLDNKGGRRYGKKLYFATGKINPLDITATGRRFMTIQKRIADNSVYGRPNWPVVDEGHKNTLGTNERRFIMGHQHKKGITKAFRVPKNLLGNGRR